MAKRLRERIDILMETLELSDLSSLAAAAGLSGEELQAIWDADALTEDQARTISARLGVEYDWIMTGTGPFQRRGAEIEGHRGFIEGTFQPEGAGPSEGQYFVQVRKARTKLSGGGGIIPIEGFLAETYAFRGDWLRGIAWGNVVLFDVDGDSMSPTLQNGDTVLIDRGRTEPRDGRIYAIAVADVVQIKRLQLIAGPKLRVISDNPGYHTYEARPDEIRILGQMIWSARTWILIIFPTPGTLSFQGADPTCLTCHVDNDGIKGTNPKTHPGGFMKDAHGDWHSDPGSVCFNCHVGASPQSPSGIGFCGYCHGSKTD